MNKKEIPELRVKVTPFDVGFYNKWKWVVEQLEQRSQNGREIWGGVYSGMGYLKGYARTEERAIEKGERAAAKHFNKLVEEQEYETSVEERTFASPINLDL